MPKGKINKGESHEECAIRETQEETGILVEIESPLGSVKIQLKNKTKTVIAYLARQVCNNVPNVKDPDSEVADASWFRVDNLPPIQSYQKPLIDKALDVLRLNIMAQTNE